MRHLIRCAAGAFVVLISMAVAPASAGFTYFLVAERTPEHGDSFVLPLSDPADVAAARGVVADHHAGRDTPIVFAAIEAGADNINRNVLAPGRPAWSWHVTAFEGFADMGLELVDGWPTYVEQDVTGWITNTGGGAVVDPANPAPPPTVGHIGFWGYTVVAELQGPPTDLRLPAAVPLPAAVWAGGSALAAVIAWTRVRHRAT
ncbi:MAG TPA: hypothetical protein VK324_02980 [Tepidisphaeraceae bacterium]|nr:hypothetical protein [Tepidisphaeraceae bacterium]